MAHLIVLDAVKEDVFVCGWCKMVFNTLELFLDHKQMKCVEENLKCVLASENLLSETPAPEKPGENIINIVPQAESTESAVTNEFTCTVCNKKFIGKRGLQAHIKSHNVKTRQCSICGRCFIHNSHLQRHLITHKVWPESLSEHTPKCSEEELLSYSCLYCTGTFSNYNQFRTHIKDHQFLKKYKCIQSDCTNLYDSLEMLLCHVSSFHKMQFYKCHLCNEPFTSLQSIASHELSHKEFGKDYKSKEKQFECLECEAVFTTSEKLSLHQLTENHKNVCIHCNKSFGCDKSLRWHMQIHGDTKPYQCNICKSSFHMKKYLTSHMLKHGTKFFKCPVCKLKFSRSDMLRRHMRSHDADKMFTCPYKKTLDCKKAFNRKYKMREHLSKHHGELEASSQDVDVDVDVIGKII